MHFIAKDHWRHRGYDIRRGSYHGTSQDCADGWYVCRIDASLDDRRGPGWRTLAEARHYIDWALDFEPPE